MRGRGPAERQQLALEQGARIHPLGNPTAACNFAGDYMTDMSSWMQGAFESARETATAVHARALVPRRLIYACRQFLIAPSACRSLRPSILPTVRRLGRAYTQEAIDACFSQQDR